MIDDEILLFDEEEPNNELLEPKIGEPWHLLVVDDDPEIHAVTQLALKGFSFDGRTLKIDSAYSALEAKEKLSKHPTGYAIALLDVVMETDHAGLDLARWIREELQDRCVRLVLRTGQPGQAPERDVITNNDYKEKTELTANKLYTLICSNLRTYRDITALYNHKAG